MNGKGICGCMLFHFHFASIERLNMQSFSLVLTSLSNFLANHMRHPAFPIAGLVTHDKPERGSHSVSKVCFFEPNYQNFQ